MIINNVRDSLIQINQVSRQLLSRIQSVQNIIQVSPQNHSDSKADIQITDKELDELMSVRKNLITELFKHHSLIEIKAQHILLDEMTSLDSELSLISQACKNTLAEQVIKLKKSKKVADSYKKY